MTKKINTLDDLTPDAENFNRHTEFGQKLLEDSLRKFGAGRSILVDKDGNIIAGNSTTETAAAIGMEDVIVVPTDGKKLVVVQRTDLSLDSPEGRELALADNMTALKGIDLDLAKVQETLGDDLAKAWGMEIPDVQRQAQEDDFDPDAHYETKVKAGEVWQLGEHRLMCGDSTKAEDFEKLMAGEKADLTFTSPPYNGDNASADGDIFVGKGKQRLYADGYSDNLESSEYVKFAESVLAMCFKHTDGFIFWNVNYNSNSKFEYIQQIVKFLPALVEQVCWKKSSAIPFKGCMRRGWEPVYIFSTTGKNLGLKEVETNIWEISNTNSQGADHKACFPVALPAKGISLVPAKSGIVLEPFGGTGTTMIACEQLNRKCYMMELDPHYCDVIIARWEKLTGNKAERISNGE